MEVALNTNTVAHLIRRTPVGVEIRIKFKLLSRVGISLLEKQFIQTGQLAIIREERARFDNLLMRRGEFQDDERRDFGLKIQERVSDPNKFAVNVGDFLEEMTFEQDHEQTMPTNRREQGKILAQIRGEVITERFMQEISQAAATYAFIVRTTMSFEDDVPEIKFDLLARWLSDEFNLVTSRTVCLWGQRMWTNNDHVGQYMAGNVHIQLLQAKQAWLRSH